MVSAVSILYHTFAEPNNLRSEELTLFCRFLTLVNEIGVFVAFSLVDLTLEVLRPDDFLLLDPLDLLLEPKPSFLARVSLSNNPLSNICRSTARAFFRLSSVIKPSDKAEVIFVLDSL